MFLLFLQMCLDYRTVQSFCLGPAVSSMTAAAADECAYEQATFGLNRCDCCDEDGDFCIFDFLRKYADRKLCVKQKLGRVDGASGKALT